MNDKQIELFEKIVVEVEKVSAQGRAGVYVHQVPRPYNYAEHWPIVAAIEMITKEVWMNGYIEGNFDGAVNSWEPENPYEVQ